MQQQIQSRIAVLKSEFETGQAKLQELELQQSRIRETLLRISGAIQVLEEMLESKQSRGRTGIERLRSGRTLRHCQRLTLFTEAKAPIRRAVGSTSKLDEANSKHAHAFQKRTGDPKPAMANPSARPKLRRVGALIIVTPLSSRWLG